MSPAKSLKVKRDQAKAEAGASAFVVNCRLAGVPVPEREFHFAAPERRFRFDFAWPQAMIALESEGGSWSKGAHTRGGHFLSDMTKYNLAALKGWRVFRTVPGQLVQWEVVRMIGKALGVHVREIGQL